MNCFWIDACFCHLLASCFWLFKWAAMYVNERRKHTADCVLIAGLSLKCLLMCFSNKEGWRLSDRMCMCVYWECLKSPPPTCSPFPSSLISASNRRTLLSMISPNIASVVSDDVAPCCTLSALEPFRLTGRESERNESDLYGLKCWQTDSSQKRQTVTFWDAVPCCQGVRALLEHWCVCECEFSTQDSDSSVPQTGAATLLPKWRDTFENQASWPLCAFISIYKIKFIRLKHRAVKAADSDTSIARLF